jgi:hypothetical protein
MRFASATVTIAAACAAAIVFSGCGEQRPPAAPAKPVSTYRRPWSDDDVAKPAWLADPTRGGSMLAAWGSAAADPHRSRGELRDAAMQSARDELARMVRVRVQSVLKEWLAESGGSAAGVSSLSESASRGIADQSIEGSYQRDAWTHPKTGETFVWVVVDPAFARNLAHTVAESAKGAATGDPTLDAHIRAKAGSDDGFRELDRLLKQP